MKIRLILFLLLSIPSISEAQFKWPNGAKAAVCLTYDDALDCQLNYAIPELDSAGLKGTFFCTGNSTSLYRRMNEWKAAAGRGHELGNHSLFHPCIKHRPDGSDYAWVKPDGDFTDIVQFLFKNIPGFSVTAYENVHILYSKWNFWILGLATATPLPYGVFSVSAGVFNLNIFIFFLTTLISQGIKYSFLAIFATVLGPKIKMLMQSELKRIIVIATAFIIIAIILSNSL